MKVFGYYSVMMSVGSAGKPKSDNDPMKRIRTLGDNLAAWTSQHLCFDERCLKAVTKETGNWTQRISKMVDRMEFLYNKCGGIPQRDELSRKKRDEDEVDYDDNSEDDLSDLMTSRYNREDPIKGIGQLTGAVRKWADNYLSDCRSQQKTANNGIPMISLRMHKWKVVLENGFHKIRKQTEEIKPTPSSWTNWYQRKIQRA